MEVVDELETEQEHLDALVKGLEETERLYVEDSVPSVECGGGG